MADTIRTLSQWLALVADNGANGITAQDLRDALVSHQVYGAITVSGGSAAQTLTASYAKLTLFAGTCPAKGITCSAANGLTVGTNGAGDYELLLTIGSFSTPDAAGATPDDYYFQIMKNGGALAKPAIIWRTISAINAEGSGACHVIETLADGDIITVYTKIGNATGSPTVIVREATLSARRLS